MEGKYPEAGKPTPQEAVPAGGDVVEVKKSPEGRPDIEVTFLYVTHDIGTSGHLDEIWEKSKNADVIFIEAVGATDKERGEMEDQCDSLSMLAQEEPNSQRILQAVQQLRQSPNLYEQIVGRILEGGGGKTIRLIDVSVEDPEYTQTVSANIVYGEFLADLHDGKMETALARYESSVELYMQASRSREKLVARQLSKELSDIQGRKRIAVVQGAAHTPTYHTVKQKKHPFPIHRAFVPSPLAFNEFTTLIRRKRFFPREEIADEDYHRAVAKQILAGGTALLWPTSKLYEAKSLTSKLVDRLDSRGVDTLLKQFSEEQKRSADEIDKMSVEALIQEDPQAMLMVKNLILDGATIHEIRYQIRMEKKISAASKVGAKLIRELAEKYKVTIPKEAGRSKEEP